jgi:hypothetical protein
MARCEFDFQGLDELKDDMERLLKEYPDETEKEVFRLAGVFTKDINDKMPAEYSGEETTRVREMTKKRTLPNSWKRTREKSMGGSYTVGVEVQNTAPHWHLVENGHVLKGNPQMAAAKAEGKLDAKKKSGKTKKGNSKVLGWVPGKGYCLKTREEWDNGVFADHIKKFVDRLTKRHNL